MTVFDSAPETETGIINNTAYGNAVDPDLRGWPNNDAEFKIAEAEHVWMANNVAVAIGNRDKSKQTGALLFRDSPDARWSHGLIAGPVRELPRTHNGVEKKTSLIEEGPAVFVHTPAEMDQKVDLHLLPASRAHGAGLPLGQEMKDLTGKTIPAGAKPNLGAYQ